MQLQISVARLADRFPGVRACSDDVEHAFICMHTSRNVFVSVSHHVHASDLTCFGSLSHIRHSNMALDVEALPTLAQQWASLGAAHAPAEDVPEDSPRIASALNTFASYVDESKKIYLSVCILSLH